MDLWVCGKYTNVQLEYQVCSSCISASAVKMPHYTNLEEVQMICFGCGSKGGGRGERRPDRFDSAVRCRQNLARFPPSEEAWIRTWLCSLVAVSRNMFSRLS